MKPRLFCFGDSFVDFDIPKYHWTYYLSHHYEFYKFAVRGSDNNSIIFQLGDLPEFEDGDRVLIMFTEPGRIPTRFYANGNLINKLDDHPGPKGCYDMYKIIHKLLNVNEPFVDFKIEDKDLI